MPRDVKEASRMQGPVKWCPVWVETSANIVTFQFVCQGRGIRGLQRAAEVRLVRAVARLREPETTAHILLKRVFYLPQVFVFMSTIY